MKPSNCTFISRETIEILCKTAVVLRKKIRKQQYDGFPHFFSDVACFEVTQCILQAFVFALLIDYPPIGLSNNHLCTWRIHPFWIFGPRFFNTFFVGSQANRFNTNFHLNYWICFCHRCTPCLKVFGWFFGSGFRPGLKVWTDQVCPGLRPFVEVNPGQSSRFV